jgi:uncharacterized protein YcnI
MRLLTIALLAATITLAVAAAAGAHVTANPGEGAAGSFAKIDFRVPHGCDESPTTSLTIQIPEGTLYVSPQAVPGWEVSTKEGPLPTPVESEGETITEGVTEVTWTGGPLAPHQFTDFGLSMMLPNKPGETVFFPAIQGCEQGETRWIQIPAEGQDPFELEEPSPFVVLTAAEGESHDMAATDTGAQDQAEGESAEAAAPVSSDDDSGSNTLAIALGAAGLAAGLAALVLVLLRRPKHA